MHGYPVMQLFQYSVPPCSWPTVNPHRSSQQPCAAQRPGIRKYVICCLICGILSFALGIMYLVVYFVGRSYTNSIGYFETIPTFVPATLLSLTGLCVLSLARRRNRHSYMIKLSGVCGFSSILACGLVTVTTTVIHMSRLQAMRECEYTRKTRTCTCYATESPTKMVDDGNDSIDVNDDGVSRFVFDSTEECSVVHNALYNCLRGIFGISVFGVLVAAFSCMLVYQLLSHERKKMIWEQLELRRRQAFEGQSSSVWQIANGPPVIAAPRNGLCRCCEQYHSHRNLTDSSNSWDNGSQFWSSSSNYYAPGADDHLIVSRMVNQNPIQTQRSGWSWARFPWQRSENQRFCQSPSSSDSQYGFAANVTHLENANLMQSYAITQNPQYFGLWGPPPPYSNPNSPIHRNRSQFDQCQPSNGLIQTMHTMPHQLTNSNCLADCSMPMINDAQMNTAPLISNHRIKSHMNAIKFRDARNTFRVTDGQPRRNINQSNTLPFRKARKKFDGSSKYQIRPDIHNVFHEPTNSNHSEMNANNTGGCTTDIENVPMQCASNNDNNGFQSLENDRIMTLKDTVERYATSDRDLYNSNRVKLSTYDYDQFNTFHTNANRVNLLPLASATSRYQNNNKTSPSDLTRYSICSAESEKTEITDLSPMTPSIPYTIRERIRSPPLHCELEPESNNYDDFIEAGCSSSNPMADVLNHPGQCYYDQPDHKRYISNIGRIPDMFEIQLAPDQSIMNQHISAIPNNDEPIWNKLDSSNAFVKYERRGAYQRSKYPFVNAKYATGYHNNKNNVDSSINNSCSTTGSFINASSSNNTDLLANNIGKSVTTTATIISVSTQAPTQCLNQNMGGPTKIATNNSEMTNYVGKLPMPLKTHAKIVVRNSNMDHRNTCDLYGKTFSGTEWPHREHGVRNL